MPHSTGPLLAIPPPYTRDSPPLDSCGAANVFTSAAPSSSRMQLSRSLTSPYPDTSTTTTPVSSALSSRRHSEVFNFNSAPHAVTSIPAQIWVDQNETYHQTATFTTPLALDGFPAGLPDDPYVDTLKHVESLHALYKRCIKLPEMHTKHLGELIVSMARLLRKARILGAISTREEKEQLKSMLDNSRIVQENETGLLAQKTRHKIWHTAGKLMVDIENRVSAEHVDSGIDLLVQAISEVEAVGQPTEDQITQ